MKGKYIQRTLSSILAIALIAGQLTACGSSQSADTSVKESEQSSTTSSDASSTEVSTDTSSSSSLYVEAIPDLPDDFYMGMDASSVLAEENSGVKYYDFDGNEADVFKVLADSGINYIRLRLWNDPYDADGNGYGGGNNDLETAISLGKRATEYGMKVAIDFHYSDFWADPKRQHAPKAWEDMTTDEKAVALSDFTKECLSQLLDEGVDVGLVQVGNEINNGMSGETYLPNVLKLLDAGCNAVREISDKYNKDIEIAIHYTNIENKGQVNDLVSNLVNANIDFDSIGLSYYPFWDGSFDNMKSIVKVIQKNYDKKVFIAETSYCYTSEDGDGTANSLSGTDDLVDGYPATVQGQSNMIRDVYAAASEAGAEGVFYWEGTWIPVGSPDNDNSAIWEKYGSGWASSYAAEYDPEDAGLYYGGCSWDNQAFFDFNGYPLESLKTFSLLNTGNDAALSIDAVPDVYITCDVGDELTLPDTASVIYNNPSVKDEAKVTWNDEDISKVDTAKEGTYKISGSVSTNDGNESEITCYVEVKLENFVLNPSFEDNDISMWEIEYDGTSNPTDFQQKQDDAHTWDFAFHFWSGTEDMSFTLSQTIEGLEDGTYQLECYAQGGDVDDSAKFVLSCTIGDDGEYSQDFMLQGWANWQNPVIKDIKVTDGTLTITLKAETNVNSWGTFDDFVLKKVSE